MKSLQDHLTEYVAARRALGTRLEEPAKTGSSGIFVGSRMASPEGIASPVSTFSSHFSVVLMANGRARAVYSRGLASGGNGLPNSSSRSHRSPRVTDSPSPRE